VVPIASQAMEKSRIRSACAVRDLFLAIRGLVPSCLLRRYL